MNVYYFDEVKTTRLLNVQMDHGLARWLSCWASGTAERWVVNVPLPHYHELHENVSKGMSTCCRLTDSVHWHLCTMWPGGYKNRVFSISKQEFIGRRSNLALVLVYILCVFLMDSCFCSVKFSFERLLKHFTDCTNMWNFENPFNTPYSVVPLSQHITNSILSAFCNIIFWNVAYFCYFGQMDWRRLSAESWQPRTYSFKRIML